MPGKKQDHRVLRFGLAEQDEGGGVSRTEALRKARLANGRLFKAMQSR
jgi:hypothetical protein